MQKRWVVVFVGAILTVFCGAQTAYAQLSSADIAALQQRAQNEQWTFSVGENAATRRSMDQLCGLKAPANWREGATFKKIKASKALPARFDWRELNGCTPIKDQGNCGSCWAFGTVGPLESAILLKDGDVVDLSEQWLVSCNQDGWSCDGGFEAFDYFLAWNGKTDPCGHSGAVLESDFPYEATDVPCACPYPHPYTIASWAYISGMDDIPEVADIKQAILDYGPVSAAIYVNDAFAAYKGGVFGGTACEQGEVNHQIVLVGWDDDLGENGAWILRNSWSTDWGKNGYMYIEYGCSEVGYGACFVEYLGDVDLEVVPGGEFKSAGPTGGPFTPSEQTYSLTNRTDAPLDWEASVTQPWLELSPSSSGTLESGASVQITLTINENAVILAPGLHTDTLTITDSASAATAERKISLQIAPPVLWQETLDADPGWTATGEWAFGVPEGVCGDPGAGFTGKNVYGYNLAGCYEDNLAEQTLTTTAIDCSAYSQIKLRFLRWLWAEDGHFDKALVQVSANGTDWTEVWNNTSGNITDGEWTPCEYDISSVADGQPQVYIRWTMGPTDDSTSAGGWNIDDIALQGQLNDDLSVLPWSGFESSGYQAGPFTPQQQTYSLRNLGVSDITVSISDDADWLDSFLDSSDLPANGAATAFVMLNASVNALAPGEYAASVAITNDASGIVQRREVRLDVLALPGEIQVTDSVAPEDDLSVPFGKLMVGQSRTEQVYIQNTHDTYDLTISDIGFGHFYAEDFNDGEAQNWVPGNTSEWAVVSNEYRAAATSSKRMGAHYGGAAWADLAVRALLQRKGSASPVAGVFARANSDFNWTAPSGSAYGVGISGDAQYWVGKYVNGSFTFFRSWTYSPYLKTDGQNEVILNVHGNVLEVYFNGNLVWSGTDTSVTEAGHIGLIGYSADDGATRHYYDDVIVTAPISGAKAAVDEVQEWYNQNAYPGTDADPRQTPQGWTPASYKGKSLAAAKQGPYGISAGGFEVLNLPKFPYNIAPGDTLTLDVKYTPPSIQSDYVELEIASNDPDESKVAVALSGEGYEPIHIEHTPLTDTTEPGPYPISATVRAEMGVVRASVFWRLGSASEYAELPMALSAETEDLYTASLAAQEVGAQVCYYLECEDGGGAVVRMPSDAPDSPYCFLIKGVPHLSVAPDSLRFRVSPGDTATLSLTLSNTGDWPLEWLVNDMPRMDGPAAKAADTGFIPSQRRETPVDWSQPYAAGTLLVGFRQAYDSGRRGSAHAAIGGTVVHSYTLIPVDVVQVPQGADLRAVAAAYEQSPDVAYVEPNYRVEAFAVPNDPRFGELWGMNNTGQTGGKADADIDAPEAWNMATGRADIIVGVIDTGVDYRHADLTDNMWTNEAERTGAPGVDDDGNGIVDDIYGARWNGGNGSVTSGDPMDGNRHGTHCSGTIGGVGNNGVGVAGVNWSVRIMALKFLGDDGYGQTADAISALEYAIDKGASLTSNSWGGGSFSQALKDAIDAAGAKGQLFIAAAGNDYSNNDTSPSYPASYTSDNIVAVAASDHNDNKADFSNWGATTVDLAAPGVNILSSTPNNTYSSLNGTSMATPHVSGAAALLFSLAPGTDPLTVKQWLMDSVDVLPQWAGKTVTGGRLNLAQAIMRADVLWLTESPASGTLGPGASVDVEVTVDTSSLADGFIGDATMMFYGDPDGAQPVQVELVVTDHDFMVSPLEDYAITGGEGGPFTPPTKEYTLRNVGEQPIVWTAETDVKWLELMDESSKQTLEPGEAAYARFSVNDITNVLPFGTYAGKITFTDQTNGISIERNVRIDIAPPAPAPFYTEPLDADPGWSAEGGWAWGVPQGQCGDPASGATGDNVYGYNLVGCYSDGMLEEFLTTTALDCSHHANIQLQFKRWLGIESGSYDHARVQVSNDGTTWNDVWVHSGSPIRDSAWQTVTADISGIADGQATVFVRWAMGPTDSLDSDSGWNIDDVQLSGVATDNFLVLSREPFISTGIQAGPFAPESEGYMIWNLSDTPLTWKVENAASWLNVFPKTGSLEAFTNTMVTVSLNPEVYTLPIGEYTDELVFSNTANETVHKRGAQLIINPRPGELVLETPGDLDQEVPEGTTVTLPGALQLTNIGQMDLHWRASIVPGLPSETEGEGSAEGLTAGEEPGEYVPSVLFYTDAIPFPETETCIEQALRRLGYEYEGFYDGQFSAFETSVWSKAWDLVIFDHEDSANTPPTSLLDELEQLIIRGGKVVASSVSMSTVYNHPLWDYLRVTFVENDTHPPNPVYWWNPDHPLFTLGGPVPAFAMAAPDEERAAYGQRVRVWGGAQALAGFTETPGTTNQAVLALANNGRTLFRGFVDSFNTADADADGVLDAVELWTNTVLFMTMQASWLHMLPMVGTVPPGEAMAVDLTFDTAELSEGYEDGVMIVISSDGVESPATVSATLRVLAPQEGEGASEGAAEGVAEGLSEGEGQLEGSSEGAVVVEGEGQFEGMPEGNAEGRDEGQSEGFLEGADEGEGQAEGLIEGIEEGEGYAEGAADGEEVPVNHTADQNGDGVINLTELLRVIQLFNGSGYRCAVAPYSSEDGYLPSMGYDHACRPHASDYNPQDWVINLTELLRLIQFFNGGAYHACPGANTEDGYCLGA